MQNLFCHMKDRNFNREAQAGNVEALRRRVFGRPALPPERRHPRVGITEQVAVLLAYLVGGLRPSFPDQIDEALAQGETDRIAGAHLTTGAERRRAGQ